MGRQALELLPADSTAAALLAAEREAQGKPKDALARECGVRPTRLRDILDAKRPMTVGELDAIASALGLVGWRVLREAERALVEEGAAVPSEGWEPGDWDVAAQYQPGIEEDEAAL